MIRRHFPLFSPATTPRLPGRREDIAGCGTGNGRYANGTGNPAVHAHLPEQKDGVAGCGTGNGRCASGTGKQTLHAHLHTNLNVGMTSPDVVQVKADVQVVLVNKHSMHTCTPT